MVETNKFVASTERSFLRRKNTEERKLTTKQKNYK